MIFILPISEIFDKINVLQTCYEDENYHFHTYSAKNPAKIPCFYDFLAKN